MVKNNSKTVACALLVDAHVPSSLAHGAMVAAGAEVLSLREAQDLDQDALDNSRRERLAAQVKRRLSKASDKRIRKRMQDRSTRSTAAEVTLLTAQDTLSEGVSENAAFIKGIFKGLQAKRWHSLAANASGHLSKRWLLVPATKLIVDLISHPDFCTRAERCERIGIEPGDHVMGASINQLSISGLLERGHETLMRTRIHPDFAAALTLKPIMAPEEPPSDEDGISSVYTSNSESSDDNESESEGNNVVVPEPESERETDSSSNSDSDNDLE
jgi:hypothetical protein